MSVHFKDERLQKHQPLAGKIKESLKVEGPSIKEEESHKAYFDNLPGRYRDWEKIGRAHV